MALYETGDGEDNTVLFVTLQIVSPVWFRRNLVAAIMSMTNESNWTQGGTGTVNFARDKSTEMLNSMAFSEENPLPIPTTPIGMIAPFAMLALPSKWLACTAQSLLRTDYPELFAVIGTAFGAADGAHFSLPQMQMQFVAGYMAGATEYALGHMGGEVSHDLTIDEMPIHHHAIGRGNAGSAHSSYTAANVGSYISFAQSEDTGGGLGHENRPPYIALQWAIYAGR